MLLNILNKHCIAFTGSFLMDMGIKGHYSSRYIDVTLLLLSKRSAFFRVAVIETDCEVDFAPPLDYKKPEKAIAPIPAIKALERGAYNPVPNVLHSVYDIGSSP